MQSLVDINNLNWFGCRILIRAIQIVEPVENQAAGIPIMMEQSEKDEGTIAALMLRMTATRLPRAQRLLEKVNAGGTLGDNDIAFLKRVFDDSVSNQSLFKRNPEYLVIVSRFIDLYTEIINKGLENEKAQ